MKTAILLTKTGIESSQCREVIRSAFSGIKIIADTADQIVIGKAPRNFLMDFTPNDLMDDPESGFEASELEKVPFKAHLTNVEYHKKETIRTLIRCLLPLYPEMLIFDDETNSIVKPSEF